MKILIISGGRLNAESAPALFEKIGMGKLCTAAGRGKLDGIYVIAVDGGLAYCKDCGIFPDHLVGDFDTITEDILQEYTKEPDIKVHRYQPQKDFTDTEAAVNLAIDLIQWEKEPDNLIYLLGGLGSRMDHTMANLGCLKKTIQAGIPMKIIDEQNCIYGFDDSFCLYRQQLIYKEYLSLLALEPVEGLTIRGMKYETDGLALPILDSRGVSNELEKEKAEVEFTSGVLMVMETKD